VDVWACMRVCMCLEMLVYLHDSLSFFPLRICPFVYAYYCHRVRMNIYPCLYFVDHVIVEFDRWPCLWGGVWSTSGHMGLCMET
jgi:hypothetical protein